MQAKLFPEDVVSDQAKKIDTLTSELAVLIAGLPLPARVDALNRVRSALHATSPFRSEPVDCVLWFPQERVDENTWNPNTVPPPEMVALGHSVRKYGYTMPIVGTLRGGRVRINDGKHRNVVGRADPEIRNRIHGYLPLSLLHGEFSEADEMSATILHNQARGQHSVSREVEIVKALGDAGWDDAAIGVGTVKSDEELVRMRQIGGAAKNLASASYANAWDFKK